MSDSKINIKIGQIEFSGEGHPDWLASQLDNVLSKVPLLLKFDLNSVDLPKQQNGISSSNHMKASTTLATWLKDKAATTNQNRKFLATAAYLQKSGKERLTTSEVTESLRSTNQGRLSNASEGLNRNVGKGFCEKDGKTFYVTPEGFTELGMEFE